MRECSYDQRVAHKRRGTDNKDVLEKQCKSTTVENQTSNTRGGRFRTEKQKWTKKRHRRHWGRRELCLSCLFPWISHEVQSAIQRQTIQNWMDKFWKMLSKVYCFWVNSYSCMILLFTIFAPHWSFPFNDHLYFPVKCANFCIIRNVSLDKKLQNNTKTKWIWQKN